MADGFLAPDGTFYLKKETYHAETARRLLNDDGKWEEPIQELLRRGFIIFIEFKRPDGKEKLQQSDMDFVLAAQNYTPTEEQLNWISEHYEELTRKQQYDINRDEERAFRNVRISTVRMFPWCENCESREEREKWCSAKLLDKPASCCACPYFKLREL
ncbi:MAG: hypothetical protein SOT28_01655 [Fusicatenibacter sp.]|nr:hypothetical protein [Fusicatenibacter sp.]